MSRIFVTGGSGFVGQNLVSRLLKDGHSVSISARPNESILEGVEETFYLDLDRIDVNTKMYDTVIHLAANNDTRCSDECAMWKANVSDPITFIEKCSLIRKVIFASSTAIYGDSRAPYLETDSPNPLNIYARSKLDFEQWAMMGPKYNILGEKIDFIGLRFCNIYGPGEEHKGSRMSMIGQMLRKVINNEVVSLFKYGDQRRDWIYVDDIVDGIIKSLNIYKNEIYNMGTGTSTSFEELCTIIERVLNQKINLKWIDHPFPLEYQI